MNAKRRIRPAIVVEGKYDKIRLDAVVDAVILVTDGFQIYRRPDQLALLRHYAETTGLMILTDADAAGFQIRGYLKGAIQKGTVYHVYIPGIHGKERRKAVPSAEGLLGVEGMDNETLLAALERAGAFDDAPPERKNDITPAVLYAHGLNGTPDCCVRRRALLRAMRLPPHLSVKGLCEVLNTVTSADALGAFLAETETAAAEEKAI
ncbi:MAG: DUF4093 domain-containing protein [Oscillospiraceae bacterium]|nr:DUF4093 domain-containing protein [Oscillospiraceae bacterium]MCR5305251.1 DUF4093 domain-containing protein [Oscillospiraceae bacterium]